VKNSAGASFGKGAAKLPGGSTSRLALCVRQGSHERKHTTAGLPRPLFRATYMLLCRDSPFENAAYRQRRLHRILCVSKERLSISLRRHGTRSRPDHGPSGSWAVRLSEDKSSLTAQCRLSSSFAITGFFSKKTGTEFRVTALLPVRVRLPLEDS
jgi:hypothetical protein